MGLTRQYLRIDPPLVMQYGDRVGPELLQEINRRLGFSYDNPTKKAIEKKWDIITHNLKPHVETRLNEQYFSDVTRAGTREQITAALNPAADIVERVCQVYKHGVRRKVSGVSQKKGKALARIYREARVNSIGQDWNRDAYFVGPIHAVPRVRSGLMRVDTILPHRRVPVLDAENPTGWPLAIAYETSCEADRRVVVVVDQHCTRVFLMGPGNMVAQVGEEIESASLTEQCAPFAGLRFDYPRDPSDYDSSYRHQRIVEGTIDVCVVAAVMGHVRKTQNKQLLFLQGALDGLIKGQNLGDPDKPVFLPTPQGQENALTMGAINFDQPVDNFLAHMRFWYAAMAESTGVPAMLNTEGPIDLQFAFDGLSELRDEQISYVEEFEKDLCCAMVMAARDGGHPVANDLPTVEEVQRGFIVQFGKMSRRLADPNQEQMALDWEIRHGLISVIDLLGKRHPEKDDAELLKQLQETLETNTKYWDFMAQRNMAGQDGGSVDASGKVVSGPQANGASGGRPTNESKRAKSGKANAGSGSSGGRAGKARGPGDGRRGGAAQAERGAGKADQGTGRKGQGGRPGEAVRGRAKGPADQGPDAGARRLRGRSWIIP